jgi:hypothetical protein
VSRTARVAIVAFLGFNLSAYGAAPKHAHSSAELDAVAVVVNMETTESDSSAPEVQFVHARPDLDASFARCVARSLKSAHVPLRVVNREDLNSIAFPGVNQGSAPRSLASITLLLDNPTFQSRLAEAGIRYLAVIGGETHIGGTEGGIWCGGTPYGACIGAIWRDHDSDLSAVVIDIEAGQRAASERTQASDKSSFGVALIIPFGKPSFVDAKSCPKVGAAVAQTLAGLRDGSL